MNDHCSGNRSMKARTFNRHDTLLGHDIPVKICNNAFVLKMHSCKSQLFNRFTVPTLPELP